jgi:glutamyl-tRNA reductase
VIDFQQGIIFAVATMTKNFKALVLTYKTAPVAIREKVSLNEAGAKQLLQFTREFTSATDVLVVSTCNRTEIYYNAESDFTTVILSGLGLIKKISGGYEEYFKSYVGLEAISHLFEVAIGLDAQVIGDLQISGQVKNAYQWSADENMAGPFLHRLLHTIFFVNKRVVQETSFRDGAASISYAAKELAEDLTSSVRQPKVLVVGVGEIGQDVCLNLQSSRIQDVTILNRTLDKAEKLAQRCGFKFGGIESLSNEIAKADVIISSVSGYEPLISYDLVNATPIPEAWIRELKRFRVSWFTTSMTSRRKPTKRFRKEGHPFHMYALLSRKQSLSLKTGPRK